MSLSKMTLIGMYNWDNTLFSNLSTPAGIDNSLLIDTILLNGGEFEVLYADFDFMKDAIGRWSNKWERTMERWIAVLEKEYNPIENYDRIEDWTDANSKKTNNDAIHSEGITRKETAVASDASVSSGEGDTENKVSAYDVATYSPHDRADTSSKGTNNSLGTTDAAGETNTNSIDSMKSNDISNGIHSGRIHGNIGVKTTQSMVMEEIDVSRFNIYDEIANLFLQELTIYTY